MKFPQGRLPSPEERSQRAADVLGAALAVALHSERWELHAMPGELYFQRGESKVEPFNVILRLVSGNLKVETWLEECAVSGISNLNIGDVADHLDKT